MMQALHQLGIKAEPTEGSAWTEKDMFKVWVDGAAFSPPGFALFPFCMLNYCSHMGGACSHFVDNVNTCTHCAGTHALAGLAAVSHGHALCVRVQALHQAIPLPSTHCARPTQLLTHRTCAGPAAGGPLLLPSHAAAA
eukprot:1147819-Pelagomonas_calceolata.AAC.3